MKLGGRSGTPGYNSNGKVLCTSIVKRGCARNRVVDVKMWSDTSPLRNCTCYQRMETLYLAHVARCGEEQFDL